MCNILISKGFIGSMESLEMSKKTSEVTILGLNANYKYL